MHLTHREKKTKLRVGDVLIYNIKTKEMTITRDGNPLFWMGANNPDRRRIIYLRHLGDFTEVAAIIAGTHGLDIEKMPTTDDETFLYFRLIK